MLKVNEVFGPTIQGEGSRTGTRSLFIRTQGCNLHCWFCDTPYTWRKTDKHDHKYENTYPDEKATNWSNDELMSAVLRTGCSNVVITGGEPVLQQDDVFSFLGYLLQNRLTVTTEIETSGSIELSNYKYARTLVLDYGLQFNVSPKLFNSGNSLSEAVNFDALEQFSFLGSNFKFVVTKEDFDEVIKEISTIKKALKIPNHQIWLMAEGETTEQQLSTMGKVAEEAIKLGYNFSPRLHTLIWGNERGK